MKLFKNYISVSFQGTIQGEYKATVIGMAVLLTLFALITINDVMNLFG